MFKYNICFLKQNDQILLLNREKPSWMGRWNGVGGKIEENESPRESALREIKEETGIVLDSIDFKGIVTWIVDGKLTGGMYAYFAELPSDFIYETPIKTPEGILDWKSLEWIMHPENNGIADIIPKSIHRFIDDANCYEHRCFYENDKWTHDILIELNKDIDQMTDKEKIHNWYFHEQFRKGHTSDNMVFALQSD